MEASLKTHLASSPFALGHGGVGAEGICPSVCHYYLSEPGHGGHTRRGGCPELNALLFSCFVLVVSWLLFQINFESAQASIAAANPPEISWGSLCPGEWYGGISGGGSLTDSPGIVKPQMRGSLG